MAPGLQADPLGEPGAELLVEMAVDSELFHYCPFTTGFSSFFIVFMGSFIIGSFITSICWFTAQGQIIFVK